MSSPWLSARDRRVPLAAALLAILSIPLGATAACGSDTTSPGEGGGDTTRATSTSTSDATSTSASSSTSHGSTTTTSTGSNGGGGAGGASTSSSGTGAGGSIVVDPGALDCGAAAGPVPALKLTPFVQHLVAPLAMVPEPGDAARFFVASQTGTIQVVDHGDLIAAPFLDLSAVAGFDNAERGLLGLALHPKYAQNGRLFVYYTAKATTQGNSHAATIVEYRRSASDPNKADPTPVATTLEYPDHEGTQNGGQLAFSPADGKLYIAFGDGGGENDAHSVENTYCDWTCGNAQCKQTMLGKILRIDVDASSGGAAYTPAGVVPGALPEIWDYGFRNPWRFSFDGCNGDLYIGDVGENTHEEIDYEPAGQGGKNYGWKCREGGTAAPQADNTGCDCDPSKFTDPVVTWPNHAAISAIIGGFVYRGANIPGLRGKYVFANYSESYSHLWWVDKSAPDPTNAARWAWDEAANNPFDTVPGFSVVSLTQDLNGELYVIAEDLGIVYRIDLAN